MEALRGALAAEREKEGELANTSLEFEYLHRKSRCKMLIGGDGISNVITLGTCFSMFVYIRTRFRITLIGGNVTAQSTERQGNWRWNSNSSDVVASSPSFSCPPESLLAGYPARGRSCGRLFSKLYYIHFEITGYPCNLIGSQQCDLFLNRTIFCSKSHLFQITSFMF